MEQQKIKRLIRSLIKTIRRLALNNQIVSRKYEKQWPIIRKKIEDKGLSTFTRREKQILSEGIELKYFDGKRMAYGYILCQLLGEKEANRRLLKGLEGDKNYDKYGNKIKWKKKKQAK